MGFNDVFKKNNSVHIIFGDAEFDNICTKLVNITF